MKKSFTSVEWMLTIAIVVILLIGLVSAFQIFFPWLSGYSCIQRQRNHINDVFTVIDDVQLNGDEQIVRFRIDECTKCIWFNTTSENNNYKLQVEYKVANESFSTPVIWNGDIDHGNGGEPVTCENLVGEKTCSVDIKVNSIEVTC
jgi:hypothetical protein